jgi:hypothetical protein
MVLHDDGTLTREDAARLREGLSPLRLVSWEEASDRLAPLLAGRPAARSFRAENPLGAKLLDAPLLGAGPLFFCDTDVLFLRPFAGLDAFPRETVRAVFMSDLESAYSVRSWHLLAEPRLTLPRRVNTGLLLFDRGAYDLDRVEWFLSRPGWQRTPVWAEQTAWALLGGHAGAALWDPERVCFPAGPPPGDGDPVALHFVSPRRKWLAPWLELGRDAVPRGRVRVGARPARWESALSLGWVEVRRRVGRVG